MKEEIELTFTIVRNEDEYPYDLLLLADESISAINKYLFKSDVYVVKENENVIAVFCLLEVNSECVELKNISVCTSFQNFGIGSKIIAYIKQLSKSKYRSIIVGTADCGLNQIRFYERNGFEKFDIRKNFYVENYEKPIIENGVQLKDMVLLKYEY